MRSQGETAAACAPSRGGALTSRTSAPAARNSQTISVAVKAVTARRTAKMPQGRRSFWTVIFTSLTLLRAMMAMTAAPIP